MANCEASDLTATLATAQARGEVVIAVVDYHRQLLGDDDNLKYEKVRQLELRLREALAQQSTNATYRIVVMDEPPQGSLPPGLEMVLEYAAPGGDYSLHPRKRKGEKRRERALQRRFYGRENWR